MISVIELKNELEKINIERDGVKKTKGQRSILPLTWDRHIRRAIGYLFRYGQLKLDDLAEKLKIHVKDIDYIIKILEKNDGLVSRKETDSIVITEEGNRVAKELGFRVQLQNRKDRLLPPYLIEDIETAVDNFTKSILPPDPYLFQWYFAPHSVRDMIEYMIEEFDVEGRNVACLMTPTIGLSLFLTGYTANNGKGVYVFDKDKDVVEELKKGGVQAVEYDVTDPVPEEFRNFFDCVIIDPPYDEDYYFVSLSRAIELLGGEQYKTIYVVVPPPEVAYLRRVGFPPMIVSVLHLLDRCWLLFENIKKGICGYSSPPFEIAALSTRSEKRPEDIKETLEKWRSSDLIKVSIFRDVASPLPGKCELPLEPSIEYERYKRRFLVKSATINSYKEYPYTKPELEVQEADEWDEFTKEFTKSPFLPYGVIIHDIGDWDNPANRLIRLKGVVAHYLWQNIKCETLDNEFVSHLSREVPQKFLEVPAADQITHDLEDFLQQLRKIKVIN